MLTPLHVQRLGRTPYREVWQRQKKLQAQLLEGGGHDTLILCEHEPVITLGRGAKPENVLASSAELERLGIKVIQIERGGDVTYHGPGQLLAYPILDLNRKRRDVGWYMRGLEEVVIRTLARYGIGACRIPGKPGVWLAPGPEQTASAPICNRKIAALGVRISRWCTLHGLSLNVQNCNKGFSLIHPCGFTDIIVTSLEEELPRGPPPALSDAADELLRHFCEVFSFTIESAHGA